MNVTRTHRVIDEAGVQTVLDAAEARARSRGRPLVLSPPTGSRRVAMSYAMLVPMGLYEPPWHYPARTIAKDLSYHLVFGAGCAAGYRFLSKG